MKKILETPRLILREMISSDYEDLCEILQDEQTMYAYAHAFDDDEVQNWLEKQLRRYEKDSIGLWAVICRDNGKMIGQAGLTWQDVEHPVAEGKPMLEIGYLLNRAYWNQGYAIEAARACKEYAFTILQAEQVCSIIRDTNLTSQKVARKNGMQPVARFVKRYYGLEMPHDVYLIRRSEWKANADSKTAERM